MMTRICNEKLTLDIESLGAQMMSLKDEKGKEYLWQGDAATWEEHAPVLFPYIGRLTEKTYLYQGKAYHMDIHGIAMYSEFEVNKESQEKAAFVLSDSEITRRHYPFAFRFQVTYELRGSTVWITYEVENRGEKEMYFGVGGHPGFCVPIGAQGTFKDYEIHFGQGTRPERVPISEDGYVLEDGDYVPLENPIHLRHDLFDMDAIVLSGMGTWAELTSPVADKCITIRFPQMKYLGIWHWPKTETPYVCIEPWTSLPARKGVLERLEEKEDLIQLGGGEEYRNEWSIEIE
ncbi:MAG: aldose 1-epimerase family protein [Lachnospiraceae bacterium]|jgi:galactose mutarotase-like enzyme|nr:aldose 1-epimerase family protein [Lachnospiraceae bacterium]